MKLYLVRYRKTNPPKHYLLLFIGERDNCIHGLNSEKVTNADALTIRKALPALNNASMDDMIAWLRTNTPNSYRNAYCTLLRDLSEIVDENEVKMNTEEAPHGASSGSDSR
jgi:hypothetical protein